MDELYLQWEESGTSESFEDWFSGRAADAADRAQDEQQDREMGL